MQIVRDHLLCVILEGQEANVAEKCFESGRRNVRPV